MLLFLIVQWFHGLLWSRAGKHEQPPLDTSERDPFVTQFTVIVEKLML